MAAALGGRLMEARFAFGRNWRAYLRHVDSSAIGWAERSVADLVGAEAIEGRSFLDAGSGSGLFSLAAARLGATRVHSFDYDADSVAATRELCRRHSDGQVRWQIERGDLLAVGYLESLGEFDVVYSWGVLHHTGDMWAAIDRLATICVAPGGTLAISLYNDQGRASRIWRSLKRTYNRLPAPLRPTFALLVSLPRELRAFAVSAFTGGLGAYLASWRRASENRGMNRWRNIVDWVGGYPFEVARPGEVLAFMRERGFELTELRTVGGAAGCNEYVFARR